MEVGRPGAFFDRARNEHPKDALARKKYQLGKDRKGTSICLAVFPHACVMEKSPRGCHVLGKFTVQGGYRDGRLWQGTSL
jgi:hypothetical protein